MLKPLPEKSRYLVVIAVLACLAVQDFFSHLVEWRDARETLEFGLAVAAVAAAPIAFGQFGGKDRGVRTAA